jgi:hypothetical protein
MEVDFSVQSFERYWNIKFHRNPPSGSRVVPWRQTDRQAWRSNYTKASITRCWIKLSEAFPELCLRSSFQVSDVRLLGSFRICSVILWKYLFPTCRQWDILRPCTLALDSDASSLKSVRPVAHNAFGKDALRVQLVMIIIVITTILP